MNDRKPPERPHSREVENENLRPDEENGPPRPATEPPGSEWSQESGETRTDPGSGEHEEPIAPNADQPKVTPPSGSSRRSGA